MASSLEVAVADPTDRLPLYRMLELYQHDLSDIWDQDLDEHGEYGYELDRFMRQSNAWAYVFRLSCNLAGFALVDIRSASLGTTSGWISFSSSRSIDVKVSAPEEH